MKSPDLNLPAYIQHAQLLCSSYQHWTGKHLLDTKPGFGNVAEVLFLAPFVLVSHGTGQIPVFNFATRKALELFEVDWEKFTRLPSRASADQDNQEDRSRLMARVKENGYEENCRGVRVTATGKRFLIEGATVWNIIDMENVYYGQAAMFTEWTYL